MSHTACVFVCPGSATKMKIHPTSCTHSSRTSLLPRTKVSTDWDHWPLVRSRHTLVQTELEFGPEHLANLKGLWLDFCSVNNIKLISDCVHTCHACCSWEIIWWRWKMIFGYCGNIYRIVLLWLLGVWLGVITAAQNFCGLEKKKSWPHTSDQENIPGLWEVGWKQCNTYALITCDAVNSETAAGHMQNLKEQEHNVLHLLHLVPINFAASAQTQLCCPALLLLPVVACEVVSSGHDDAMMS